MIMVFCYPASSMPRAISLDTAQIPHAVAPTYYCSCLCQRALTNIFIFSYVNSAGWFIHPLDFHGTLRLRHLSKQDCPSNLDSSTGHDWVLLDEIWYDYWDSQLPTDLKQGSMRGENQRKSELLEKIWNILGFKNQYVNGKRVSFPAPVLVNFTNTYKLQNVAIFCWFSFVVRPHRWIDEMTSR
jgi:hypothetical protein